MAPQRVYGFFNLSRNQPIFPFNNFLFIPDKAVIFVATVISNFILLRVTVLESSDMHIG